jgi:uncharacterized protein
MRMHADTDRPGDPRQPPRPPADRGTLPFLVRRDGTWLYRGSPIERKALVCLFSSILRREADGEYWLESPAERGRIQVEDTPWLAVELDWCGSGRDQKLRFRTNIDEIVTAGPDFPIRVSHDVLTCEPTPYLRVRPPAPARHGRPTGLPIEARICRAVYYEMVALAVVERIRGVPKLGVWSQRSFFPLGIVDEHG